MGKTLRYFELKDENGEYFLADGKMLEEAGLTNDEALRSTFGGTGVRIKITLHPPTERLQKQIIRDSSVAQPDGSVIQDFVELPRVRAQVMIASWKTLELTPAAQGEDAPEESAHEVTNDFYGELHPLLANHLDKAILAFQYPVTSNPDFLGALRDKLKPSETAAA